MKKRSIFVTDVPAVREAFRGVLHAVDHLCEEEKVHLAVKLDSSPVIPRKWEGYEFPLSLKQLTLKEFERNKEAFCGMLKANVEIVANKIFNHAKGDLVLIRVALISRCKKSRGPGVLIFWEK